MQSDHECAVNLKRADIEKLVSIKSSRISFKANVSQKSVVWKCFQLLYVDQKYSNFVKCNNCNAIFTWSSHNTGTKSLLRHSPCGKQAETAQADSTKTAQEITAHLVRRIPDQAIFDLNKTILIGLAKDLRPLRTVEGDGFLKIAQSLINFGAKNGKLEVKNIINHRTTLKRSVLRIVVGDIKSEIIESMNSASRFPNFAFSFDMWSEDFRKRQFLSVSVHYFDENFDLKCKLLGVDQFPDQSKTMVNIRREIVKILSSYFDQSKVDQVFENSVSVTDGGSNMIKVFKQHFFCQCHKLNLLLQHAFSDETMKHDRFSTLHGTLHGVKNLVSYFKRSGLNSKLKITLKQAVETRWNSNLIMLESYYKSATEIRSLLIERHEEHRLDEIELSVVEELVHFLKPFRDASEKLSSEKMPTFHLVAMWFHTLEKHLSVRPQDSSVMRGLKDEATKWFNKYCVIEDLHYAASILHPRLAIANVRYLH